MARTRRGASDGAAVAARTEPCLLLVAAAGYGKTNALDDAYADGPVAYHRARDLVAHAAPTPHLDPDGGPAAHVVVDDLAELTPAQQLALAKVTTTIPDGVRVSLGSRRPLSRAAVAVLPGLTERSAADLAMVPSAVAAVLREEYGVADAELAYRVHEVTAGWPALVRLAGIALDTCGPERDELLAAMADPGTKGAAWLGDQVLAELPRDAARLLEALVDLDPISVPLCAALAADGLLSRVPDGLRQLIRTGLVVACPTPYRGPAEPAYRVVPVLAAVVAGRSRPTAPNRTRILRAAAGWYAANGRPLAAARALRRAGDEADCRRVIEEHGDAIVASAGHEVARLIEAVPPDERSPRLRLLLGDALRVGGDVTGALRAFEPLLTGADRLAPALAWRAAMVPYMRSDYRAALALVERASPPAAPGPTVDDAYVAVGRASALALLGEPAAAAEAAADALSLATAVPVDDTAAHDRALAAAHLAGALVTVGARRERHLADAQAAAERAGDVVQLARVLTNRADGLLRAARYPEALDVAARAVRAVEATGPPGLLTVALSNAGEALRRLGRFEEAALRCERAVIISRRVGLNRTAAGLWGLAELHRLLGRREQSRAAFEEAVELSRAAGDQQICVPALTGLVRLLLEGPEPDLDAARAAAEEAVRVSAPLSASRAVAAQGWVALAAGELALARERAQASVAAARASRRSDCLAEALELAAATSPDPGPARAALREAEAIWRRAGAEPAADQMLVLLGRLPGADAGQRQAGKAAAKRLRSLGIGSIGGTPLGAPEGAAAPVYVRVLGRFEVLVGGRPVPMPAWRSRQARSLFKILVARRGRPVSRTEVCEVLWPDDDSQRTGHRLSVLLSVIRTVLDPAKLWPADHHVRADAVGVSLDLDHVVVDAEELQRDAAHAAALARAGEPERAREILAEVDAAYRGDAFDDEPYEDWAQGLREETRAAWLRALRQLAGLAARAGDADQAVAALVRLLAADAYDEPAYRALVGVLSGAGRHGEARRSFDRWTQAMRSIDASTPDPGLLKSGPRPAPRPPVSA
jgi:DNA-binding SARP family transcriptional activator/ATP/maltotriose-dependent transcriptional regulator MalT